MSPQTIDILTMLGNYNAIIKDSHFVLTSGKHADAYVNIRALAGHPEAIHRLASLIHAKIMEAEKESIPENAILVGPETMGRSLAEAVSLLSISSSHTFSCAWCESSPDGNSRVWSEKLDFSETIRGKVAYIIDDVLTTAKTLDQTIELITSSGAKVGGVVMVINRNPSITAETLNVPWLISLLEIGMRNYSPENCPLCQKKIPMRAHPGHGYEWLESHPDYPVKD